MTLVVKTRYATHQQTAERLYLSMQIGAGIHATGRPYPVKPFAELERGFRVRLFQRAAAFERMGEETPPKPLPERLHAAWWFNHRPAVVPYRASKPWVHELWSEIAAAYTALSEGRAA
jgi:transposase InsO family protein